VAARSFSLAVDRPGRFVRAFADAVRSQPGTRFALVLLSGELAAKAEAVASELSAAGLEIPMLLATGSGVLTEKGELDGPSAGVGLAFSQGQATALVGQHEDVSDAVQQLAVSLRGGPARRTAIVFARARGADSRSFEPLAALDRVTVLGAGCPGDAPVFAIDERGGVEGGPAGALVTRGLAPAHVRSSPACRLLMQPTTVTESRGPLVLRLAGEPALQVLRSVAANLEGQPLLLTALAPPEGADEAPGSAILVRGIQGVDPSREGVMLSEEVEPGQRLAFAVRDPEAARKDLEETVRELSRELAGAAPLAGLYFDCAGRGTQLYGASGVDLRLLRARFPDLPLIGMRSAFELAPHRGRPALHSFTGVLGLFTNPS
jgi:small ligand-binding sensory domain FIST